MINKIVDRRTASAWQKKFEPHAPKAGDLAPDFELLDSNGENPLRLSESVGEKPAALIFGSFTWPPFVRGTVSLDQLYEKYHQQVKFILVYIREAHPVDGWWFGKGLMGAALRLSRIKAALDVVDPTTLEERRKVAGQCKRALEYGIHTYVDEMDDAVNQAYAAWPTRLYLVGRDRRVVYAGGPGPFGFRPAELEKAIEAYLA